MLTLKDISFNLGDKKKVVSSESLLLNQGLWALVGRNGAGKSTLIRAIIGTHPIEKGSMLWKQSALNSMNAKEKASIFSVVFTKPELFGNYTVEEVVALGRLPFQNVFGQSSETDKILIEAAIHTMEIVHLQNQKFQTLSDGEKQLVMIARAIAQDTPVIILDEPTAFLDVLNRRKIVTTLKKISVEKNKVILYSTHDIDMIPSTCDGLLWIDEGTLFSTHNANDLSETLKSVFN